MIRELQPLAKTNLVDVELAVVDGGERELGPGIPRMVLEDTIATAIQAAPGGERPPD